MKRKKAFTGPLLLALGVLLAGTTMELGAQQGRSSMQRARGAGFSGKGVVTQALRLADELDLSEQQRSQLNALREEQLEQRTELMAQALALRSEIASGLREPEALRSEMRATMEASREARAEQRTQVEGILTEDQRTELRSLMAQNRRGQRMRARRGGGEGEGFRGRRGARRGGRGL